MPKNGDGQFVARTDCGPSKVLGMKITEKGGAQNNAERGEKEGRESHFYKYIGKTNKNTVLNLLHNPINRIYGY